MLARDAGEVEEDGIGWENQNDYVVWLQEHVFGGNAYYFSFSTAAGANDVADRIERHARNMGHHEQGN